ncbi:hypothetical protein ACFXPA_33040 [Amycolatopsis sp. NPDC059090]
MSPSRNPATGPTHSAPARPQSVLCGSMARAGLGGSAARVS